MQKEPTISDLLKSKRPKIHGLPNKTNHAVGIEVELEKVVFDFVPLPWKRVKDNSLKQNGSEFTAAVYSNKVTEVLTNLKESLKNFEANKRCSVHVHVDITEYTLEECISIAYLYILFEKTLFRFSGRRENNPFCVPVTDYLPLNPFWENNKDMETLETYFPKYAAMHFFPDHVLGTVEFRHMAGNFNIKLIQKWVEIVISLVQYAKGKTLKQCQSEIKDPVEYLYQVFGKNADSLNYSEFEKTFEDSKYFADIFFAKKL